MSPRKISILADAALRLSLAEQLARHGDFALADVPNAPPGAALPAPPAEWPDALVICADAGDAVALAGDARRTGFAGPVVLILDAALFCDDADAILTRPLRVTDLVGALEAAPLRIGPWRLTGDDLVATGTNLRLTEKEAAILRRLARTPGVAVSRAALLRDVWGYAPHVASRTLETHIHRLRRKMEREPGRPRWLLTTADGYRLAAGAYDSSEDSAAKALTRAPRQAIRE